MHHENSTLEDLSSSHNQIESQEIEQTMTTTSSSKTSTSRLSVPKTVRDEFF